MERIPEHIVESSDQEELDQIPKRLVDWLMGASGLPVMLSLIARPRLLITHTVLSTKVFLNEMLARGALVILSLFVAGFWSEVDCAGLLSGAMGQCEEIHFCRRPWTRPRQGFRHAQENCDRRHRRRFLERTHLALLCKVWSSLRSSASRLGQPLLCIEFQGRSILMWLASC